MKYGIFLIMVCIVLAVACEQQYYTPANFTDTPGTETSSGGLNVSDDESDSEADEIPGMDDTSSSLVDLSGLPTKRVKEGGLVSLRENLAVDPDGDVVQYDFSDPFGPDGDWQTEIGDAGEYVVNITATDGDLTTVLQVRVIVEAVNRAPVIENFGDVRVREGETVQFDPQVKDPDGEEVEISYSGWMENARRATDFDDAGEYTVQLTASDGVRTATRTATVYVENVNRAPRLMEIGEVAATEGDLVTIPARAEDPDGDTVTYSFTEPFNDQGQWQTSVGDAASYSVVVVASDGQDEDSERVVVRVVEKNAPPVLDIQDTVEVYEGETVVLSPEVSDPDNDKVSLTYSGWMQQSERDTDYDDAGEYEVNIEATDGTHTVSRTVTVIVKNVNRPPVFIEDEVFE